MKHDCRHCHGWFIWVELYEDRTRAEGYMADFVECCFRTNTTIDRMKKHVEEYLKALPPATSKNFTVEKRQSGGVHFGSDLGYQPLYKLRVMYKTRHVISIHEPSTREFHADRQSKNFH